MKSEKTHVAFVVHDGSDKPAQYDLKIESGGIVKYWSEVKETWSAFPYFEKETADFCGAIISMNIIKA